MSAWEPTTPDDATYLANVIHTQMQADKVMLSERFEANDGTIDAHKASDDDNAGVHEASKVGWVKVHATVAARDVFTPVKEGTLHFVTDIATLFIVDSDLAFFQIFPVNHLLLEDRDADDHNYQDITFTKAFTADLKLASLTVNDATGAGATDPLDEATHAALDWEAAHGAGTLHNDHMANGALTGADVCTTHSWSGAKLALAADTYGFPWHAGDGAQGNWCHLRVYNDGMAFYRLNAITDGTFKCGKFKA